MRILNKYSLLIAPLMLIGISATTNEANANTQLGNNPTYNKQISSVQPTNINQNSNLNNNNKYTSNNGSHNNHQPYTGFDNNSQPNEQQSNINQNTNPKPFRNIHINLTDEDPSNDSGSSDDDYGSLFKQLTQLDQQIMQPNLTPDQISQNQQQQEQVIQKINKFVVIGGMGGDKNGGNMPIEPAYQVDIPCEIILPKGQKPINFNLAINPTMIPGYDWHNKRLTANNLVNGTVNGATTPSNSPAFGRIFNQIPAQYSTTKGVDIPEVVKGSTYYVVNNGKKTNKRFIMKVTAPATSDNKHWYYSTTDWVGNRWIESDDSSNGSTTTPKPGALSPDAPKGFNNGNPQQNDSADQSSDTGNNAATNNPDSTPQSGGGSGGGSGKGAAAAAGTASTATGAAGGAGGGATGGASSTGGGSSTGGAGGGTDGTTGGVVGGGSGNNNSAVPGPTNNDVIPGGSSTSNNNNDDNNNVVDESPIVNNNDHTSDDIHHNYEAEVRDDTALIGIIANLAATDQKNHQVMADLIDKDGNQSVMRQLQKAEYASNIRTQQEDQNSSLAAEIQRTANAHHSENETQSLADHFAMQSAELSMAQSAEIANLKSAPKAKSIAPQVNNNVQPETVPVNQNQGNNDNSIGTDIMNKFDNALNGVTDQLGDISSQLGSFHASAASNNTPAPANIVQPSMSSKSSQSSAANNQIMTNFDNLLNGITGGSGSSSTSSSNSANNSPIMNNFDKILNNIAPSSGSYEPAHSSSAPEKPAKTKKASENGPFFYNPDGSEDYAKERQFDEDHGDPYAYFVGYNGSHGLISPAPAPVEMPQIVHLAENKAKAKKNDY